jgi:hypothetical protein
VQCILCLLTVTEQAQGNGVHRAFKTAVDLLEGIGMAITRALD